MKHCVMKAYGGGCIDSYFLDLHECLALSLGRFTPGERAPDIRWIGGSVDPRADLDEWKREIS
jgi:hypothetical protein